MNKKHTQSRTDQLFSMPHATDIECVVIGALMLESRSFTQISTILTAKMFYELKHEIIYNAISGLHRENKAVDMLTVMQYLQSTGVTEVLATDIASFASSVVSSAHIVEHALIIKDKYIQRCTIELCEDIKRKSYESIEDVHDLLFSAGNQFDELQEKLIGNTDIKHISPILGKSLAEMYERVEKAEKGIQPGINAGLADLNRITGGWQNSDLIVIAARPAMGKTAMAIHFAKSAARQNIPVAMFSLEMSDVSLANRLILSETNIDPDNFKLGRLSQDETIEAEKASGVLSQYPLYVDDNPAVSMSYIRSRCRLLHKQNKCSLVIIDYLQLTSETGEKNRNREQEVAQMSREAKVIAKELNLPVLLLSQLSRAIEARADKKPQLSDLRESGAIEQDADLVMFIHRPEYYGVSVTDSNGNAIQNYGELLIAKNRNGSTSTVKFTHNGSLTKIFSYDYRTHSMS